MTTSAPKAIPASELIKAIRTHPSSFSRTGVVVDSAHQTLTATINGVKVNVNYAAQSLPRIERLMAKHGIAYEPKRSGSRWWGAAWALLLLVPPIMFWVQVKARRRKTAESA